MEHSGGINQHGDAIRDIAMIEAAQAIPLDGLLDKGDLEYLPTYLENSRSQNQPLVVLDCVKAIVDSMEKSRLLLLHIARKERSVLGLLPLSFKLSGIRLEIDRSLAAFLQQDWMQGHFGGAARDDPEEMFRLMHDNIIIIAENSEKPLKFGRKNLNNCLLEGAKARLLQLDKNFRDAIVEPLKNTSIYKSSPDYELLFSKIKIIQKDILVALFSLAETIKKVRAEIIEALRQTKITHLLLLNFPEEIADAIYCEISREGAGMEEGLVFFKLVDGRTFTERQKEEVKKLARDLLPKDELFRLAYVDQCFDFPVDEASNKVGAAVKQIIFGLPEDPSVRVANPESLEWYREWIVNARRGS